MLKFTETITDRNGRCKRIIESNQLSNEECIAIVEVLCGIQRFHGDEDADLDDMEEEFAKQLVDDNPLAEEVDRLRERVDYLEGVIAGKHLRKGDSQC